MALTDELAQVTEDSARGGFFIFSGATIATIVMAIAAIVVGRLLGPDLYGQYNLVLVIPSLLLLITDLGINSGITKFSASLRAEGKADRVAKIIQHGTIFRLFVGVVISILGIVFADSFAILINRPDLAFYVQIASISIVFQVMFGIATSAFVGLDRAEYNALATNLQAAGKTILSIAFVLLGFGVGGALIGYVGGYLIASIIGVVILLKFMRSTKMDQKSNFAQTLRLLTSYGMPLYVSVLLIGILPLYQQVVLAFFASNADFGNYRAASNFIALLSIIPASVATALLPAFSKFDSTGSEEIGAFFKRANKYTCILMIPTTTLLVLFSRQIVQTIYGSVYQSASYFLSISALPYFLVGIGSLTLISLFNGLGKTRITLKVTIVNFIALAILSPIFSYTHGVVGALVASVLASVAAVFYAAYVGKRHLKVEFNSKPIIRTYMISFLSSLPCLALLLFVSLDNLITLIIGGITYLLVFVTLMPLAGIVNRDEIRALKRVTGRIPLLSMIAKPVLEYQTKILNTIVRPIKT